MNAREYLYKVRDGVQVIRSATLDLMHEAEYGSDKEMLYGDDLLHQTISALSSNYTTLEYLAAALSRLPAVAMSLENSESIKDCRTFIADQEAAASQMFCDVNHATQKVESCPVCGGNHITGTSV